MEIGLFFDSLNKWFCYSLEMNFNFSAEMKFDSSSLNGTTFPFTSNESLSERITKHGYMGLLPTEEEHFEFRKVIEQYKVKYTLNQVTYGFCSSIITPLERKLIDTGEISNLCKPYKSRIDRLPEGKQLISINDKGWTPHLWQNAKHFCYQFLEDMQSYKQIIEMLFHAAGKEAKYNLFFGTSPVLEEFTHLQIEYVNDSPILFFKNRRPMEGDEKASVELQKLKGKPSNFCDAFEIIRRAGELALTNPQAVEDTLSEDLLNAALKYKADYIDDLLELSGEDKELHDTLMYDAVDFTVLRQLYPSIGLRDAIECAKVGTDLRIDGYLGGGVAGRVFKVFDSKLERTDALKVLLSPGTKEAKILASLQEHRNEHFPIVYSVGETFYNGISRDSIRMEYIDGIPLAEDVKVPDADVAYEYLNQLEDLICFLESEGIKHRDLNLNNIYVTDGILKVLDFGIATRHPGAKPKDNRKYGGTDDMSLANIGYKKATGHNLFNENLIPSEMKPDEIAAYRQRCIGNPGPIYEKLQALPAGLQKILTYHFERGRDEMLKIQQGDKQNFDYFAASEIFGIS